MNDSLNFSNKAYTHKTTERSLYLNNDQYNDFEHVINCLVAICDHNEFQAEQCALIAHYNGRCEIAIGNLNELTLIKEDLALYGLDVEIV